METSHDPKEPADQQPTYKFAEAQPSHAAIEAGNPAIFKPRYLVLDDINVDLLTVLVTLSSFLSIFALHLPMVLTLLAAAAVIFPLRLLFPRPAAPQGTVLITGASSGIGAELSYIFAERGHDLVLVGRNEKQLESVKNNIERKYGKSARAIAVDLSIPNSPKQLYEQVKNDGLTVEILVNNAGLGGAGETMEQPIELAERMTTLNCIALVQLTQLFGKDMIDRERGWILHVSSVGLSAQVRISTMRPNITSALFQKPSPSSSAATLELSILNLCPVPRIRSLSHGPMLKRPS